MVFHLESTTASDVVEDPIATSVTSKPQRVNEVDWNGEDETTAFLRTWLRGQTVRHIIDSRCDQSTRTGCPQQQPKADDIPWDNDWRLCKDIMETVRRFVVQEFTHGEARFLRHKSYTLLWLHRATQCIPT